MSTNIVHPNINPEEFTFEIQLPNLSERAQDCIAKVEKAFFLRSTVKAATKGAQGSTTELVDALVKASSHGVDAGKALVLQTPEQGLARKACTAFFAGIPESVTDDYGNLPPNCLFPLGIVAVQGGQVRVGCPDSGWFTQEVIQEALKAKIAIIRYREPIADDPSPFLSSPTITQVTPNAQKVLSATMRENPTE